MVDNNENKGKETQWWAKVTLKEWALLIGGVGFFYLTIVGGVESLKKSVDDIKVVMKEDRLDNKAIINDIRLNQEKMRSDIEKNRTEIEVLKIQIKSLERK